MSQSLIVGNGECTRCWWCGEDAEYMRYHDVEWGRPVYDDVRLFEKICLEGFQAGLSWLTILRKRENFRIAFEGFDYNRIANYGQKEIDVLLENAGIIRHRGKIEATINNARRAIEMEAEFGSLSDYFWRWKPEHTVWYVDKDDVPSETEESRALSKDLKKRGWKFIGPTTCYAFMQAMGLVNDHLEGCFVRDEVA